MSYMLTPTIGLMQITTWARTTYDEFIQHWGELQRVGAKALVLDLRDNTGGYMTSAVAVANEFLQEGQLIVYTEGRTMPREDVVANGEGLLQKMPLVVLVNENSASASEIFSGAMQDHDRAMIIGRQTYGCLLYPSQGGCHRPRRGHHTCTRRDEEEWLSHRGRRRL